MLRNVQGDRMSSTKLGFALAGMGLFLALCLPSPLSAQANTASGNDRPAGGNASQNSATPQSMPGAQAPQPKPGDLGYPFQTEHFWNHLALELSGGYVPVVGKGAGYFDKGFLVTAGVVDHLNPHFDALIEMQFFGLSGASSAAATSNSNTDFGMNLDASYTPLSRAKLSPYLIGGVGYYYLGPIAVPGSVSQPCTDLNCPTNVANSSDRAGYNGGVGMRRRLVADRDTALFVEARYHYIASKTSDFGQLSLFPISAGLRW